jgi:hypothetical protein
MPDKMEYTGGCQSNTKFNMPLEHCLYKWKVPFIINLKGKEYTRYRCQKEGCSKHRVPEFSVKLKGIVTDPVKKVTD